MKKTLCLLVILFAGLFTGCSGKDKNAIEMYVDDYGYAYSFSGISTAENGNTVAEITMQPIKNSEGNTADLMTALNVGGLFLMETYIVCDGEEFEYNENSLFAIDSDDNNEMGFVYKFEFDTNKKPETVYLYPSQTRDEPQYHWQIDPETGEILIEATITVE